jgi:endonuclease/exonuclease/phosphatase family metal-dependent hydrolase
VEPVRVLSYNVQGHGVLFSRRYLERVARVIEETRPDVVGLQEVHRGSWKARSVDQARELARLTGMRLFFGPSFVSRGAEFGNAVLTPGEILDAEVVPLPGPGEPRTLLHSRIALRNGARPFDFYVTHLAAWGRWQSEVRGRQVEGVLHRLRQGPRPFVLVGDLNAGPRAPELLPLLSAEIFRRCEGLTCTHRVLRQEIDYVFADPGWTTVRAEVLRTGPSDHWPLLVELQRAAEP